jgi:hypothetical protein
MLQSPVPAVISREGAAGISVDGGRLPHQTQPQWRGGAKSSVKDGNCGTRKSVKKA